MADASWEPRKPFLKKLTLAWVIIVVLSVVIFYRPSCPAGYTPDQAKGANCIVGANTGFGLMLLYVVLPLTLTVMGLWGLVLFYKFKKPRK